MMLAAGTLPVAVSATPDTDGAYCEFRSMYLYGSDHLAMSSDGMRVMAASSYWGFVGVYSISEKGQIWQLGPEGDGSTSYFRAAMSADGKAVAVIDTFGLVRYYIINSGTAPVWSYNTSLGLSSVCISGDGGRVIASVMGGAAYFNASGYQGIISDPGVRYYCAVTADGKRALLGHGSAISIYNGTMVLKKNDGLPAAITDLDMSSGGTVAAAGTADGVVKFYNFYNSISPNNFNWTYDLGTGSVAVTLTDDGRNAALTCSDGYGVYDVAGAAPLWMVPTPRPAEGLSVSGDGSYAVVSHYLGNQVVMVDRAGKEIRHWSVSEARNVLVDGSGDTIALLTVGLDIYRPGLDIIMDSGAWTVSAGIASGFGLQVTQDGVPVSGASLDVELSENVAVVSVADQGSGRYWVTVTGSDVNETTVVTWNATVSAGAYLNGTAAGTLTVLPVDDPANYDSRLQGLSDQLDQAKKDIGDLQMLQLVTLVVIVVLAMVIVFLMARHSKPPAPKQ